jgi:hypothetical protein
MPIMLGQTKDALFRSLNQMGTLFIAPRTVPPETCERLNQAQEQYGFELAKRLSVGSFHLYLYRKLDGEVVSS